MHLLCSYICDTSPASCKDQHCVTGNIMSFFTMFICQSVRRLVSEIPGLKTNMFPKFILIRVAWSNWGIVNPLEWDGWVSQVLPWNNVKYLGHFLLTLCAILMALCVRVTCSAYLKDRTHWSNGRLTPCGCCTHTRFERVIGSKIDLLWYFRFDKTCCERLWRNRKSDGRRKHKQVMVIVQLLLQ